MTQVTRLGLKSTLCWSETPEPVRGALSHNISWQIEADNTLNFVLNTESFQSLLLELWEVFLIFL